MKTYNDKVLPEILIFQPEVFYDYRGEYIETYNEQKYNEYKKINFVQDDVSISRKDVLRGLHGDNKTWKLIQCLYGSIMVVIVDCNKNSKTYYKHSTFHLNDKNLLQILIPPNYANGHLCISDKCIFSYKQSEYYNGSEQQFTVLWNDPDLNIKWPITNPILSLRDKG
jgi:dTDP-4-dehydrorhamnose 3,5-epimerase